MRLFIGERDGFIAAASLCDDVHPRTEDEFLWRFGSPHTRNGSPVLEEAARQAAEYFSGGRTSFDLPLLFKGTEFQRRVWQQLRLIPFGRTVSYGELAGSVSKSGCLIMRPPC